MADALEIQNSEELNTTSDSEFNGFTESEILDMGDDTIVTINHSPPHLMSKRLKKRRMRTNQTMDMVITMMI